MSTERDRCDKLNILEQETDADISCVIGDAP